MDINGKIMRIKRENLANHLVEYQLNMVGKTIEDAKLDPWWFHNITCSQKQFLEFRAYAIPLIKKVLKCNKKKAEHSFLWLNLQFGLRVVPTKEEHEDIVLKMNSFSKEESNGTGKAE